MTSLLPFTLVALSFLPIYQDGMQAYENNNYAKSVGHFEELVYNRVYEPEVFHNLGNAYYKMGYLAPAIVNYERALRLDPTLEESRDNLRLAVSQTKRAMPRPVPDGLEESFYFWHTSWTDSGSRRATLVCWFIAWMIVMSRILRPQRYSRRVATLFFLLALVFAGSWWFKANPAEFAVANGDKIPVRYGPKQTDTIHFELFEGDRVYIDGHRDEWVRVVMSDGTRGWTRGEYVLPVWPPRDSGADERMRADRP
ncbi:MAG: tetratricopeptide repeat protein [Candidatus Hydrogenedentota bacterium]